MTDQQRWDAMGCTSGGRVITPALDSLAAEGTLFTHAYTSCPSSTPARAGLLTGLSPWHHGMLGYGEVAPRYRYEMPRMLREAGYYTFGIGKMHWHPQRERHGFHATLLDESGRVEDVGFVSDYRCMLRGWILTVRGSAGMITGRGVMSLTSVCIPPAGRAGRPVN